MNVEALWNATLEILKTKFSSPTTYDTWFSNTKLKSINNNQAILIVEYEMQKKMLKENYNDLIEEVFTEVSGSNFKFEYLLKEEIEKNIEINTDIQGVPNNNFDTNLNSKYTFENYVVGESNKFAYLTAMAVAEKPGLMYNPLFIYGNSGLGKTHLMHAIGNYIVKNKNERVLYVPCSKFIEDFTGITDKKRKNNLDNIEIFKQKYRDIDVLIIDDIQYLSTAEKTQTEFFNTFESLYGKNKQIIIASDKSPDDLKYLEERLITRFNWGITTTISPPDFDLRMNIIDNKIKNSNLDNDFPQDVKEYIASNSTNVRKIEGAITKVVAYATMMSGSDITLDLAVEALQDFFTKTIIAKNKIDQVQQIVSSHYNVTVEDLKSKKRKSEIVFPRQIAMYICRNTLDESLAKIGLEFGGKDHTTVMSSIDKINKMIKNDKTLEIEINKIIDEIK